MHQQEKNLKKKIISGFYWLTSVTFLGQVVSWVVTLIVIRLLTPEDYGLLAMATILTGFLTILSELGLGAAIIQKKEIEEQDLRKLFGCVIVFNFCLFFLVTISAPLVAQFFSEPRVIPIMRVLGINFIFLSFYFLPKSLLQRDLNYKRVSLINLSANVFASALTLCLALTGFGVWAIVWGMMGMQLVKAGLYNSQKSLRYAPIFSLRGTRSLLRFGGHLSFSRIIWYFYSRADIVIAGRIFGKEQLGVYSIAIQLVTIPLGKIGPIISQIGLPSFSRIQDNLAAVQRNFLKITRVLNLVSFPVFFGITSIADVAVPALLGMKWDQSAVLIQILCLVMPLRFINTLFAPVVSSIGRPDIQSGNMIIAIIIMPAAFLLGSRWGIIGLCSAWVAAFPVFFLISAKRILNSLEIPLSTFIKEFHLPAGASIIMALAVYLLKGTRIIELPALLTVVILCSVGAFAYCMSVLAFNREIIIEVKSLFLSK